MALTKYPCAERLTAGTLSLTLALGPIAVAAERRTEVQNEPDHTHQEQREPLNFYGGAAIAVESTGIGMPLRLYDETTLLTYVRRDTGIRWTKP
jgi:hypothetical protein